MSDKKPRRKSGGMRRNKDQRESERRITSGRNLTRRLKSDEVTLPLASNLEEDVDECSLGTHNCPTYSYCINKIGSYRCICLYNGNELGPEQKCLPNTTLPVDPVSNANQSVGVVPNTDLQHLFGPNTDSTQLRNDPIGRTNGSSTINGTNHRGNDHTSVTNSSTTVHGGIGHSSMTVTMAVALSSASCILIFLLLFCWLRNRYKKRYPHDFTGSVSFWCDCIWQRPKNNFGLQALGKSSVLDNQQFTSNPNYYSAPPEISILKSLMHLEIASDRLAFLDVIGEGCFGKVFKGVFRKNEAEICDVAIKILKENSTSEIQLDFIREVEIMSSFEHENILALLGVVVVENGSTPWMVFEFMEYGDLAELLRESTPYFYSSSTSNCHITKVNEQIITCAYKSDDLPWLATQVASGMTYLSSQHFVHRDLATRNCLVGKGPIIKISDFGMSRDIYTSDYYKIGGSRMLPVRWMAPESVMYGKFTLETDVWSFGVVLWEIFAYGKQPYYGHSNEEVVKLIRQGILLSPPEDCPHYICQLMEMCWRTNPYDRIKFTQIYELLKCQCQPDGVKWKSICGEVGLLSEDAVRGPGSQVEIRNTRVDDGETIGNYLVPRTITNLIE